MSIQKFIGLFTLSLLTLNAADANPKGKKKQINYRPEANRPTLGLGVGMSVPSEQLDTFILRIRINPNFTLEPMVNFTQITSSETTTITDATDPSVSTSTTTTTDLNTRGGGLAMRYRIGRHGTTDMNAIAGLGYATYTSETSVEGSTGKTTSTGEATVANIGLGMESFFAPRWSAGFDVTTPIYQNSSSKATSTESMSTGMALAPSFKIMLAHYF